MTEPEKFVVRDYIEIPTQMLDLWLEKLSVMSFMFMMAVYRQCCFLGKQCVKISLDQFMLMLNVSKPSIAEMRKHSINYGVLKVTHDFDVSGRAKSSYYEIIFPEGCEMPPWFK